MNAPSVQMISAGAALPVGGADAVGNKAFNLARMAEAGLPVPPSFVLTTAWCGLLRSGATFLAALNDALTEGVTKLERLSGSRFGGARKPLLLSVRSGAKISMPGMMETVLDVGMNEQSVEGLIRSTGNPRLAWDSYRRLILGFSEVVAGLKPERFDLALRDALITSGVEDER